MSIEMITDLTILLCSQIGFLYGVFTILIKQRPLYLKMVVLAMACMMVSRIYVILQYLTKGDVPDGFNLGMLGLLGCFLFLFSANYGMIDGLADDGSAEFMKYRLISFIAPAVLLAGYCSLYFFRSADTGMIMYTIVVFFIALSARYHFKHIIFPDIEFGVVRLIRGYNAVALLLCLFTTLFIISVVTENSIMYLVTGILVSLCCLIIIPLLKKEATKWTTI
ncbi:MAG TPA: hypothetical protein DCP06_03720 [Lachnospiraceae bacterium]|nr:hypothetical protein [Lachnospiraceae bacterium]